MLTEDVYIRAKNICGFKPLWKLRKTLSSTDSLKVAWKDKKNRTPLNENRKKKQYLWGKRIISPYQLLSSTPRHTSQKHCSLSIESFQEDTEYWSCSGSIYRRPSLWGIRILRVGAQCLCPTPSMLTLTPAQSFHPETPSWWTRTEWRRGTSTPPPARWCWPGPARGRRRTAESRRYRSCSHPGDLRRGEMKL